MRIFILLFTTLALSLSTNATPKDTVIADVQEFTIDGVQVILKKTPNAVVSSRLFIKGGTTNYTAEKEGIEQAMLQLMAEGGTKSLTKDAFNTKAEKMGTHFTSGADLDYSHFSMLCVKDKWNESWDLFSSAVLNPLFDEKEFVLIKERLISAVKQGEGDPDNYLRKLAKKDVFANTDYIKNPEGSPTSLQNLTIADIRAHHADVINKQQAFLVVVGNITKEDLMGKIRNSFNSLPQAPKIVKKRNVPPLNITASSFMNEERDIPTNYIMGVMNAPVADSVDNIPMKLATSILLDRLFIEVRTKRNLSYSPRAFMQNNLTPFSGVYATSTDPNATAQVMVDEIKKIRTVGFDSTELVNKKNMFLTQYYMQLETNESQSLQLGAAEVQGGWERTMTFINDVNKLKVQDLNRAFNKYTKAIRWSYLGKMATAKKEIFEQNIE